MPSSDGRSDSSGRSRSFCAHVSRPVSIRSASNRRPVSDPLRIRADAPPGGRGEFADATANSRRRFVPFDVFPTDPLRTSQAPLPDPLYAPSTALLDPLYSPSECPSRPPPDPPTL
eukprot:5583853-Pyramimonas_sp.AAC.1